MQTERQGKSAKSNAIEAKKCVTHEFRVSYPAVIEPKSFEGQDPKFSVVMCFDKKSDLNKPANAKTNSLKKAAFNAAAEKYGPDKSKWPKKFRMPFRDGDEERADTEGYKNVIFVSASSKKRPGLVNQRLEPITNEDDFYAGCYARAELIAFVYDNKGNRGVSFSLQNIQKTRDGDPLSGRKRAEDVFETVEDGSDDEDNYDKDEESGDDDDTEDFG